MGHPSDRLDSRRLAANKEVRFVKTEYQYCFETMEHFRVEVNVYYANLLNIGFLFFMFKSEIVLI